MSYQQGLTHLQHTLEHNLEQESNLTLEPDSQQVNAFLPPNDLSSELFSVPRMPIMHQRTPLRINVSNEKGFELGDPIELSGRRDQEFSKNQVSQLPTPIVFPDGFSNILVPPKRSNRNTESANATRAVSEFVPGHYDHTAFIEKLGTPSRNVSNPIELKTPENSQTIPLPPSEDDSKISEKLIYSPASRSYFAPIEIIGSGSFSNVALAQQISDPNVVVAVKIISVPTTDLLSITNFKSYITRELGILSHLEHPCVIKLFDYNITMKITPAEIDNSFYSEPTSRSAEFMKQLQVNLKEELKRLLKEHDLLTSNKQYYFLKYCPGGNLFQYLHLYYNSMAHELPFWKLLTRITAELVATVSYLHAQRVIHRDIKLENILLNFKLGDDLTSFSAFEQTEPLITLTDFGLSKRVAFKNLLLTTKCGSQDYVSPELLMGLEYDGFLLDSWSVGVVVYAILENRLPFDMPPVEFMEGSNISPSVIKRRRQRHNPAYRIAMIDWDWYRTLNLTNDRLMSAESKSLIRNLMALVDSLLIRKEKRKEVSDLLHESDFLWIRDVLPPSLLKFDSI